MRLFTFSGISGTVDETNEGYGMIELAADTADAFPAGSRPDYDGRADVGHFRSFVNYGVLASDFEALVSLNGSSVLNEEARAFAPKNGGAVLAATAVDPKETVLILAHSQGTNLCVHTLTWIFNNSPAFYTQRAVRCAFFDPKLGTSLIGTLFGLQQFQNVCFLFFQSEKDMIGNQNLLGRKFISSFPNGDHLWVKGLGHSSIREWDMLKKTQKYLVRDEYPKFLHDYAKKKYEIQNKKGKPTLSTQDYAALDHWANKYPMSSGKLTEALLGFLQGSLPAAFSS